MAKSGHLMIAVRRELLKQPDLTRRDLAARTGASMSSMHQTLRRLEDRGELTKKPLARLGRGGTPRWMYRLRARTVE
jgi:DNA-binding MarR family transcriptional regulator